MVRILLFYSPENGFQEHVTYDVKAKLKMTGLLTCLAESEENIKPLNYLQEALIAKNYGKPSSILGYSILHYIHKFVFRFCLIFTFH